MDNVSHQQVFVIAIKNFKVRIAHCLFLFLIYAKIKNVIMDHVIIIQEFVFVIKGMLEMIAQK